MSTVKYIWEAVLNSCINLVCGAIVQTTLGILTFVHLVQLAGNVCVCMCLCVVCVYMCTRNIQLVGTSTSLDLTGGPRGPGDPGGPRTPWSPSLCL